MVTTNLYAYKSECIVQTNYSLTYMNLLLLLSNHSWKKHMNDADEFRAGIFQQVDFYQILWGAISTRGPSTFLEIISK